MVKFSYHKGYKPAAESSLVSELRGLGAAPFVSARLRNKSAVVLYATSLEADDIVELVAASPGAKFSASIVVPPPAES